MVEGEPLEEEEEILENATYCPSCDETTAHDILREKKVGDGADFMLRCRVCQHVHTVEFRPPPPTNIPFILTDGPRSERVVLVVDADEAAANIARITALRTDMVRVKLTLTRGEDSTADVIVVPQETTFTGSHLMEHNGETWRIRAIHTGAGRTMRGTVNAPDIKRMYLHEPPNPEHFTPRTPRERRQAWKEGRLGHNPNPERPKEHVKKGVNPNATRKRPRKKKRK